PLDNRFQKSEPIVGFEDLGRHHAVTLYALVHVAPSALRRCYRVPAWREQHALIEPADAYQHCGRSDRRQPISRRKGWPSVAGSATPMASMARTMRARRLRRPAGNEGTTALRCG